MKPLTEFLFTVLSVTVNAHCRCVNAFAMCVGISEGNEIIFVWMNVYTLVGVCMYLMSPFYVYAHMKLAKKVSLTKYASFFFGIFGGFRCWDNVFSCTYDKFMRGSLSPVQTLFHNSIRVCLSTCLSNFTKKSSNVASDKICITTLTKYASPFLGVPWGGH